jgi:hypothetical protein
MSSFPEIRTAAEFQDVLTSRQGQSPFEVLAELLGWGCFNSTDLLLELFKLWSPITLPNDQQFARLLFELQQRNRQYRPVQ